MIFHPHSRVSILQILSLPLLLPSLPPAVLQPGYTYFFNPSCSWSLSTGLKRRATAASAARHPKGSLAAALPVFTPPRRWRPRARSPPRRPRRRRPACPGPLLSERLWQLPLLHCVTPHVSQVAAAFEPAYLPAPRCFWAGNVFLWRYSKGRFGVSGWSECEICSCASGAPQAALTPSRRRPASPPVTYIGFRAGI